MEQGRSADMALSFQDGPSGSSRVTAGPDAGMIDSTSPFYIAVSTLVLCRCRLSLPVPGLLRQHHASRLVFTLDPLHCPLNGLPTLALLCPTIVRIGTRYGRSNVDTEMLISQSWTCLQADSCLTEDCLIYGGISLLY